MAKGMGDGTGMGKMPPTEQGDQHTGGDESNRTKGPYQEKRQGGPKQVDVSRTTPVRGSGMGDGT